MTRTASGPADPPRRMGGCSSERVWRLLPLLLICAVGTIAYANSLNGEFLWDDLNFIRRNVLIRDWSQLGRVLLSDPGESSGVAYGFYRPLQTISYMLNYSLGKYDVRGFHAVNILFHLLASLALCRFAAALSGKRFIGLATGLLYVSSPLHVEAVAYLSGRADAMALLFMLLCLMRSMRASDEDGRWNLPLALLYFTLALLSKESSAILPLLLVLYHVAFGKRMRRHVPASLLAVTAAYALVRVTLLKPIMAQAPGFSNLFERVPGVFAAIFGYSRLLILPLNLHPAHGEGLFSFADPPVLAGMAITGLLLGGAVLLRTRCRLLFFSVAWFFVALLPVSNLFKVVYYMADHYLYVPSIGFFLLVGKGLHLLQERRRPAGVAALALLVAASAYATVRQNELWLEPESLFEQTIERGGSSWQPYLHLGDLRRERGDHAGAIDLYRKALEGNPGSSMIYANLGHAYNLTGDFSAGARFFVQAIRINPKVPQYHNNLGVSRERLGMLAQAAESYRTALALNPYDATYSINVARLAAQEGRVDEALGVLERSLAFTKGDRRLHALLAELYFRRGDLRRSAIHRDLADGLEGQ